MLRLDINIVITIINVLLFVVILRVFFFKPVKKVMAKRQEEIDKQFADAKNAEEEANALKSQYEKSVSNIADEKARALNEARAKASEEYDRIVEEAKSEAGKIVSDARKTAVMEQEKSIKETKNQLADLIVSAATKVVASGRGQDADRELYNQFLAKTGDKSE